MIIGKATNQYIVENLNNAMFPYLLQSWVVKQLSNHSDLLLIFERAYEEQERKEIERSRW